MNVAEQPDKTPADKNDGEKPADGAGAGDDSVSRFLSKKWGSHWSHHAQVTPDSAHQADKKAAQKRKRR
jgi:hypothetical protein